MAAESDGVNDAAAAAIRTALMAAAQVAEQRARAHQQAAHHAAAASAREQRELAERLRAERSAARAQLATVHHAAWWDRAAPATIAQVWQTALAWQGDPVAGPFAADAAEQIRRQVRDRFGVDVGDLMPSSVRDALDRLDRNPGEEAEAAALLARAVRQDHGDELAGTPEGPGEPGDHGPRDLSADDEAITARRIAAANQALPAQRAVSGPPRGTAAGPEGGPRRPTRDAEPPDRGLD